jgi:hypothetical protein
VPSSRTTVRCLKENRAEVLGAIRSPYRNRSETANALRGNFSRMATNGGNCWYRAWLLKNFLRGQKLPKPDDQKCIPRRRKSFIGHPSASSFLRGYSARVFQRPQAIAQVWPFALLWSKHRPCDALPGVPYLLASNHWNALRSGVAGTDNLSRVHAIRRVDDLYLTVVLESSRQNSRSRIV